jgi:hypothetical protein
VPMRRVLTIACLLMLAAAWASWSIHAASSCHELGQLPRTSVPATVAAVRRDPAAFAGKMLSLTGRMTERCPTAGCWFYLNDGTGDLRVDAGAGNFSVSGLPIGARVTVYGKVIQEPGEDPQLAGVGVRS